MAEFDSDDDQSSIDVAADSEHDIVENFARQLDELCAATLDMNTGDDEHDIPFGYEQLPQDDEDEREYYSYSDEHLDTIEFSSKEEVEDRLAAHYGMTTSMVLSLNPEENISQETSTVIKDIMKTIQIPNHAIPEWAKSIPESSWIPKVKE